MEKTIVYQTHTISNSSDPLLLLFTVKKMGEKVC